MITRSAVKKSFINKCEVAKPLASMTESKPKSAVKTEMGIQTPITAYNGKHNSETNSENVQSPVFNIHVHIPTTMTSDLNQSSQFQPIIHLHIGELVHKASPGTTSENFENINKTAKVELPSEVNYNSEEPNNLHVHSKPPRKNIIHKKLSFSRSKGTIKNLQTEKSEAIVKSIEKTEEFLRNSFHKIESPVRRSVRQANNRKLSKALKDLNANKNTTKIKTKRCKNVNTQNKSKFTRKTLILKEPVVILQDIMKEVENINFHNDTIDSGQEACFSSVNANASDVGGQKRVEEHSYGLLSESDNEENSEDKKENEKNLKKSSDDQNMISVSKKFGEIYPIVYSSDSETSSVSDFLDNCIFSEEVREILQNIVEPEKGFGSSLEAKDNFGGVTKNNQVSNDASVLISNDKDPSLNLKYNDRNNDEIVSMNSKSNNPTGNCNNKPDSGKSDLSQTAYFDKDNHQTASLSALDLERVKNCMNSKNSNLVKNIFEENNFSSTKSENYKEININTRNFQLELIQKEMKNRDITVKKESSRKKFPNKKETSQNSKEASEKSLVTKKLKHSNKMTGNTSEAKKRQKSSSVEDYIPLQISGPTEFAVAQLSKIKPYSAHKAKNFKNEMLFGKRVNRYSNPKYLETYSLKRKAAAKRNK